MNYTVGAHASWRRRSSYASICARIDTGFDRLHDGDQTHNRTCRENGCLFSIATRTTQRQCGSCREERGAYCIVMDRNRAQKMKGEWTMRTVYRWSFVLVVSMALVVVGFGGTGLAQDHTSKASKTQKKSASSKTKANKNTNKKATPTKKQPIKKQPIKKQQPTVAKQNAQTGQTTAPQPVVQPQPSSSGISNVTAPKSVVPVLIPTITPVKKEKPKDVEILNVSYDPTRELYEEFNAAFAAYWLKKTEQKVTIKQSHGGSGKQARSVIDGLEADVVTLALSYDIDAISKAGLIQPGWEAQFKDDSAPYTSTIVFLVRKGNPKNILDWNDLIKQGVSVITPNPKTSGGAKWNFLAAWGYFQKKYKNNEQKVIESMTSLYKNVAVLDSGARGSTTTFVERGIGDVYIAWENEAHLIKKQYGGEYEIVTPSISILAQPNVAVVDKIAEKRGTKEVATAYLDYLYTEEGQTIAAKNFYRPLNAAVLKKYEDQFDDVTLTRVSDFGGWEKAQEKFFKDGAIYDQIFSAK